MATVSFPFTVKYHGHFYTPHEAFEADDAGLDKLISLGAKVAKTSRNLAKTGPPGQPGKPAGRPAKYLRATKASSAKK